MRRFFVEPARISGASALLEGSEARHLAKALRLKAGEIIELFDGSGAIHTARIVTITRDLVEAAIVETRREPESEATALHLGQALAKGKKMDFIIQKATELGVATIQPFVSEYCVAQRESAGREERRLQRWQRIALEACKQSGRPAPPVCRPTIDFADLIRQGGAHRKLLFWEQETATGLEKVFAAKKEKGPVMILIGPEGGFSRAETAAAREAGFQTISLGKRILRTETASLAAVAILQYLLGNLQR